MIKVPTFSFSTTLNSDVKLTDYHGMNIVLYFYPQDNTPGCIQIAKEFRDHMREFADLNTIIFGVSRDSLSSHIHFKQKHAMPFELISDRDEKFCKHFQVVREKKLHGITYDSIVRSTFLINAEGVIVKEWRGVVATDHVSNVLEATRELNTKEQNHDVPAELLYAVQMKYARQAHM